MTEESKIDESSILEETKEKKSYHKKVKPVKIAKSPRFVKFYLPSIGQESDMQFDWNGES